MLCRRNRCFAQALLAIHARITGTYMLNSPREYIDASIRSDTPDYYSRHLGIECH